MWAKLKQRGIETWKLDMGLKKHLSFFPHRDQLHCQHLEVVDKLVQLRMNQSPLTLLQIRRGQSRCL